MNSWNFINRIKKDLPELLWHEDKGWKRTIGNYFVTEFRIQEDDVRFIIWSPTLLWKNIFKVLGFTTIPQEEKDAFINKLIDRDDGDEYEEGIGIDLDIYDLKENEYKLLIEAIRKWMIECDRIRKSDKDEDQIVIIHPDCDEENIGCILRDCKCIVKPKNPRSFGSGWRAAVISTKDWDFGKDEFVDAVTDSTGDSLSIYNDDDGSELQYINKDEETDFIEELEKVYPGANMISKIYITDWD